MKPFLNLLVITTNMMEVDIDENNKHLIELSNRPHKQL